MARKPMITRTIESTEAMALCLDIVSAEPCNKTFNLTGTFKTEEKLLKAIKSAYDTDSFKVVSIVSSKVVESLYGMDSDFFLENAVRLDPETRKPIEDGATDIINDVDD